MGKRILHQKIYRILCSCVKFFCQSYFPCFRSSLRCLFPSQTHLLFIACRFNSSGIVLTADCSLIPQYNVNNHMVPLRRKGTFFLSCWCDFWPVIVGYATLLLDFLPPDLGLYSINGTFYSEWSSWRDSKWNRYSITQQISNWTRD